jgi:UDP-N-acetylmuramoyl-L-alanyl-D-glutamate--2,6-diaminopimelate ligase
MTPSIGGRRLCELLEGIADVPASRDRGVHGIHLDSRRIERGDLFVAMPGMVADGRDFIGDAVANGAGAIVYESGDGYVFRGVPVPAFPANDLRRHLGVIASRFHGEPSRKLVVIGVTGTNGKTTCTQLLAQVLSESPKKCAVIGTLGYGFSGALDESRHTTPDAVTVHGLFADFLNQGASHVAMEVSSHALEQGRVNGVAFDVAVFTNLTRDHLDYHGDMVSYGLAKAGLFAMEGLKYAVINHDDAFGRGLLASLKPPIKSLSYGIEGGDVRAVAISPKHDGLTLRIATPSGEIDLNSRLIGRFNAYNLLAVLATLLILGMDLKEAVARLAHALPPAGRVERFGGEPGQPLVVVDYAHTPDALEKVLRALREHTPGKLWCVFGCGGDRDRGKRPVMGTIAERLADVVVLTDDNPRHESGDAIVAEILAGMRTSPQVIRDRRAAIQTAIRGAAANDIVLVAGKGHEDYQQFGDQRFPYSDRETVQELIGEAA